MFGKEESEMIEVIGTHFGFEITDIYPEKGWTDYIQVCRNPRTKEYRIILFGEFKNLSVYDAKLFQQALGRAIQITEGICESFGNTQPRQVFR